MVNLSKKNVKNLESFRSVPVWLFLVLFLISGTVSVLALRQNNKNMIVLRTKVYDADKNGVGVERALDNLRKYVYSHMNTDLSSGGNAIKPPIQLKYTYERLTAVEKSRVDQQNQNVYTDAQYYCEQQNSTAFSGRTRVPCIQDYVTTHTAKANTVPPALYKFDFISPAWSPDLAGWSLVVTAVFFILFLTSLAMEKMIGFKLEKDS
jgi:hypothetical protein